VRTRPTLGIQSRVVVEMKVGESPKKEHSSSSGVAMEHVVPGSGVVELPLLTKGNYHVGDGDAGVVGGAGAVGCGGGGEQGSR
jgi:hypothetical protein